MTLEAFDHSCANTRHREEQIIKCRTTIPTSSHVPADDNVKTRLFRSAFLLLTSSHHSIMDRRINKRLKLWSAVLLYYYMRSCSQPYRLLWEIKVTVVTRGQTTTDTFWSAKTASYMRSETAEQVHVGAADECRLCSYAFKTWYASAARKRACRAVICRPAIEQSVGVSFFLKNNL